MEPAGGLGPRKRFAEPRVASNRATFVAAKKVFLERNKLSEADFVRLLRLTKEIFPAKPRNYDYISDPLSRQGNIPFAKAETFAQFVFYNWERL